MANFFRVTLANPGALAAPQDGFIDATKGETYFGQDDVVGSRDLAIAKERGNVRFQKIIEQLSIVANPIITHVEGDGAADVEPTEIAFTVFYDRPDYLQTQDELAPLSVVPVFLYAEEAIVRFIARALIQDVSATRQLFVPTDTANIFDNEIVTIEVGKLADELEAAEALVTVEAIEHV